MNRVEVQIGKGSRSYRVRTGQGKNPQRNIGQCRQFLQPEQLLPHDRVIAESPVEGGFVDDDRQCERWIALQELGLTPPPYLYPAFRVSRWQGEHLLISGQYVPGVSISLDEAGNDLRIPDPHRVGLCFRVEIRDILRGESRDQRVEPVGRGRLAQEGLEFLTMTGVNLVKIKKLAEVGRFDADPVSFYAADLGSGPAEPLGGLIAGEVGALAQA